MSWWRDGSNISGRTARCPAWGRLIQLRDGREWDAFVYANFEGSQNFERISGVKIFELCQQAAMDRIRTLTEEVAVRHPATASISARSSGNVPKAQARPKGLRNPARVFRISLVEGVVPLR